MKENVKNFVCREKMQFTEAEIKKVIEKINSQFAGNKYGITFDSYHVEDNCLNTLVLKYNMPTYTGRDSDKARLTMRSISFLIWKERGQIEIDWKNNIYEDYAGYVFSGDIVFHADWIGYKQRTIERYQKKCPYTYGESIEELLFTEPINYLYKDLQNCKKAA